MFTDNYRTQHVVYNAQDVQLTHIRRTVTHAFYDGVYIASQDVVFLLLYIVKRVKRNQKKTQYVH